MSNQKKKSMNSLKIFVIVGNECLWLHIAMGEKRIVESWKVVEVCVQLEKFLDLSIDQEDVFFFSMLRRLIINVVIS